MMKGSAEACLDNVDEVEREMVILGLWFGGANVAGVLEVEMDMVVLISPIDVIDLVLRRWSFVCLIMGMPRIEMCGVA